MQLISRQMPKMPILVDRPRLLIVQMSVGVYLSCSGDRADCNAATVHAHAMESIRVSRPVQTEQIFGILRFVLLPFRLVVEQILENACKQQGKATAGECVPAGSAIIPK